jgi:GNAT superfamily N-acetyltransferase
VINISRIDALCITSIRPLLESSLNERFQFLQRLTDDWDAGRNRFDRKGEALFVAASDDHIVAICGLNRDPYAVDDTVGRLRHLYVLPTYRRQGTGRCLVLQALDFGRRHFRTVRLRTDSAEAASFYENLGFERTAAPECTHCVELGSR